MKIRELGSSEAESRIDELVDVIRDSVAGGASVNFLHDVRDTELLAFWRSSIADQAAGGRHLFVAEVDGRIVGTTLLILAPQQNAPHRAEVSKMLVHSSYRRAGAAAGLLATVEEAALRLGRTLLLLDTEKDSAGERLYESTGWQRYGEVPGHALLTDGTPAPTSFFYKQLRRGLSTRA